MPRRGADSPEEQREHCASAIRIHRSIRLDPGTTKNDEGRLVYPTPELVELLRAQDERVQILEMRLGKPVPHLFPAT